MKKIVLSISAIFFSSMLIAAKPAPIEVQEELLMSISKEDTETQLSCDLYKARDMCCPIWCSKKNSDQWKAAKAVSGCAKGFSCDWSDSPSTASFQCGSSC